MVLPDTRRVSCISTRMPGAQKASKLRSCKNTIQQTASNKHKRSQKTLTQVRLMTGSIICIISKKTEAKDLNNHVLDSTVQRVSTHALQHSHALDSEKRDPKINKATKVLLLLSSRAHSFIYEQIKVLYINTFTHAKH